MKLSIAIPTLNRVTLLLFTLTHFVRQIKSKQDVVEILVCNNASEDNTSEEVTKLQSKYPFIKFYDCTNRVSLGDSFKRTVSYATGDFVILWGDDDIPAPFLIDYLLKLIEDNDTELFYFNRLVGYEDGVAVKSLTVYENSYQQQRKIYKDSTEFINENFWGATFMSAVMFSKEVWQRGLYFDTTKHYGFEFMGILYYGNKGRKLIYEEFPLCIQRKVAKRAWGTDWPKYALLGLPNMAKDLEKEGLFNNGFKIWQSRYNKFVLFCYILMSASTNKKKYRPMCSEMATYQQNIIRKFLVYAIIYCMPGCIYNISRKILFMLKH